MAKQCKPVFFCKLTKSTLVSSWIFQSCTVLTNTKLLPLGQRQNTIGMFLVNLSNTIGMLRVNSSDLQTTCHAVLIIYKSYATCFLSSARGIIEQ